MVGALTDITNRKQAEDALLKEKEYYHSFVESLNEWVWEMDLKGVFVAVNRLVW